MGVYQITKEIKYYVDDIVAKVLNKKRKLVLKKDRDFFFIVDGDEGSGKSFLAFQLAKYLDPRFNLTNVAFTGHQFLDCIKKSKKGQAIVFDEAFTGLSARASLSEINKLLIETIMEVRKKNLFVFIVLPSVFYLDRYVVLARARVLFHTYFKGERRGFYSIYDKPQIKWLMLKGRKTMSYAVTRPRWKARFMGRFALDTKESKENEKEYSNLKIKAVENKRPRGNTDRQLAQRNILIYYLNLHGVKYKEVDDFAQRRLVKMVDYGEYMKIIAELKQIDSKI